MLANGNDSNDKKEWVMERGVVNTYDRGSGHGTIGRAGSSDVHFSIDSILSRDRQSLKQGDMVWFEVENIQNIHTAINIRRAWWPRFMEKGMIKSYDKDCGLGTISRGADSDIKFFADSIIGKARAGLKHGDLVFFDIGDIKNLYIATNIRKCA